MFLNRGFKSLKDAVILKQPTDLPWNTVTIIPENKSEQEDGLNDYDEIDVEIVKRGCMFDRWNKIMTDCRYGLFSRSSFSIDIDFRL